MNMDFTNKSLDEIKGINGHSRIFKSGIIKCYYENKNITQIEYYKYGYKGNRFLNLLYRNDNDIEMMYTTIKLRIVYNEV